jgi:molecular chaperone DnaK (HSP70)
VPIEPRPAGSAVCVGFEYDRSGLVRVSVSEQGGTKVLKSHTLDLNRTAESNSELRSGTKRSPRLADAHTHPPQAEDAGNDFANPPQLSNFLIEQVERQLAGSSTDWAPIRSALQSYRELLAAGRDAEIDDVEEQLYTWLDSMKTPGAGGGDMSAGA